MLITQYCDTLQGEIDTLVYVGAYLGEDLDALLSLNPRVVLLIEADPVNYAGLCARLNEWKNPSRTTVMWCNALVSNRDNEMTPFYRFNNQGRSSSMFPSTALLRQTWPGLAEDGDPRQVHAVRLDTLLKSLAVRVGDGSALVIHGQGSEGRVLEGLGRLLSQFRHVEVQVSTERIYAGAPVFSEVKPLLEQAGFRQVTETPWHGDVLFSRQRANDAVTIDRSQAISINRSLAKLADLSSLLRFRGQSKSQLGQDIFVLSTLRFKRSGFFVEFGATNGVDLSNTWLLEQEFGWTGILAEPAMCYREALAANRRAAIDPRCVFSSTGCDVVFNEVSELSTIDDFSDEDCHAEARRTGRRYSVETVSLIDLLEQHNAPGVIDYLSIDTEGSEYEILKAFDFSRYRFRVITVEHNFRSDRALINDLLVGQGFKRVFEAVSQFDDWYVCDIEEG